MPRNISLYWWGKEEQKNNFGDILSPKIVEYISGCSIVWATISQCDLISTGSLLQMIPSTLNPKRVDPLQVWGTGLMYPTRPSSAVTYCIHGLRGPLTEAAFAKADFYTGGKVSLGDPGLLANVFLKSKDYRKNYRIGFIPHHKQIQEPSFKKMMDLNPNSTLVDVTMEDPIDVIRKISECEFIVSSSLHGLIIADSLKIPNVWLELRALHRGGRFKFYDYFLSVGRTDQAPAMPADIYAGIDKILLTKDNRYLINIDERQKDIEASFPQHLKAAHAA